MTYTVFFEIFGKKMKTTVEADDENDARSKIIEDIIFHKVVEVDDFPNEFCAGIIDGYSDESSVGWIRELLDGRDEFFLRRRRR